VNLFVQEVGQGLPAFALKKKTQTTGGKGKKGGNLREKGVQIKPLGQKVTEVVFIRGGLQRRKKRKERKFQLAKGDKGK